MERIEQNSCPEGEICVMFTYIKVTKPGYTTKASFMLTVGLFLLLVGLGQAYCQSASTDFMFIQLSSSTSSKEIENFQVSKERHDYEHPEKAWRNEIDVGLRVKEYLHLTSSSTCQFPVCYVWGFDQSGGANQSIQ